MKKQLEFAYFFCISIIIIVLAFYILSNTIFSQTVLPNVKVAGENLSFKSASNKSDVIQSLIESKGYLNIIIDEYEYQVSLDSLDIEFNFDDAMNIGKGANIFESITEGADLIDGKELEYEIDVSPIISKLPIQAKNGEVFAYFEENIIYNCDKKKYRLGFDEEKLKKLTKNALERNITLEIKLETVLANKEDMKLLEYCEIYPEYIKKFNENFRVKEGAVDWDELFSYKFIRSGNSYWVIRDHTKLKQFLAAVGKKTQVDVDQGEYFELDGQIILKRPAKVGKILDLDKNIENITAWLQSPMDSEFTYTYKYINPALNQQQLPVVDFTQQIAEGKTRIDIIRFNIDNPNLHWAESGLNAIHNTIVQPGEEFSFINAADLVNGGQNSEGDQIVGMGSCNSTTTIFRAVLDGGFPITERHYHKFYVESYEYGDYPMNIVDAAFFSNPKMDLKFINDYAYPILIQFEKYRPNDGYQYHTVKIFTNSNSASREVELYDFTRTDVRSEKVFNSSFKRRVVENGMVILEDMFESKYY